MKYNVEDIRQALNDMRDCIPAHIEMQVLLAQVTRAKYNALLKEGFTEAQALELCRTL